MAPSTCDGAAAAGRDRRAIRAPPDWAAARRLFLEAVKIDLPPESQAPTVRPDGYETWEAAAAVAKRVNQEPLFFHFVTQRMPGAPLSASTLEELAAQSKFHAFRWAGIREATSSLLEAFAAAGVRPVLLKGIAWAGELYNLPRLRPMRDVDLLVRPEQLEEARRTAMARGFVADPSRHPESLYENHHHIPPLFHTTTGTCLEIHHHLMRLPDWFRGFPPLDDFWASARESRTFPERAMVLGPTHEVVNICINISYGDSIGRRAQNLIDLARLIALKGSAIDWGRLEAYASKPDVACSMALPLSYLAREKLPAAPEPVLAKILERSGLRTTERQLLWALIDRYRIGAPPPWPLVSGRISNILWRWTLKRGSPIPRAFRAAAEVFSGALKE